MATPSILGRKVSEKMTIFTTVFYRARAIWQSVSFFPESVSLAAPMEQN